jgi:hypothetical protein
MSLCAIVDCPGLGYLYRAVLRMPDGRLRKVTLCTEHRKRVPADIEVVEIEKVGGGGGGIGASPYVGVMSWPNVPFVLAPEGES